MEYFDSSRDSFGRDEAAPAPAIFLSHGAPSVILDKGGFFGALGSFARNIPRPSAVAVLSAHWLTRGAAEISSVEKNDVIHDFGGFPRELYETTYPAPGHPELAGALLSALEKGGIKASLNQSRGLDHGAWVPLKIMYPEADVPVVEISIPFAAAPELIFKMGKLLGPFREGGVMLIGSGGMTHNLSALAWGNKDARPSRDVLEFEAEVMRGVESGDNAVLFDYEKTLRNAAAMHPTNEHFLPLFFTMGGRTSADSLRTIYDGVEYGALSMRSFALSALR